MRKKDGKKQIFLHLGLIKTGTTFLQKEVFPKMNVNYFLKPDLISEEFTGNKILISKEEWCHKKYVPNHPELLDFDFITLQRLAKIFPNAKIILGVRNDGFKKSLYSRFLLSGSTLSYNEFVKRLNKRFLNQTRYILKCREFFNDVFVYTLKDFKDNPQGVVDDICTFMEVSKIIIDENKRYNVSLKPMQLRVLRLLNSFKIKKIPGFNALFTKYIRPL